MTNDFSANNNEEWNFYEVNMNNPLNAEELKKGKND